MLDERIVKGAKVWVNRTLQGVVVSVSEDKQSCQVRIDGDPESLPPRLCKWHELKLSGDHL